MKTPFISVYGFDADGCLYNNFYHQLVKEIINEFGDVFSLDGRLDFLAPNEKAKLKEKVLAKIKSCTKQAKEPSITNHSVLQRIKSLRKVYERSARFFGSEMPHLQDPKKFSYLDTLQECIQAMNAFDPAIMREIFLTANQPLIAHLEKHIEKNNAALNVLGVFSNRQSFDHDQLGQRLNTTGSIYQDIQYLLEALQLRFPNKNIAINPEIAADSYGDLKPGTSFEKIIRKSTQKDFVQHASYIFDETKLSLVYMWTHSTVKDMYEVKDSGFVSLNMYDNEKRIHDALCSKLTMHANVLPKETETNLFFYDGNAIEKPLAVLAGKGEVDEYYSENICRMAMMCQEEQKRQNRTGHHVIDVVTQVGMIDFLNQREEYKQLRIHQDLVEETTLRLESLMLSPRPTAHAKSRSTRPAFFPAVEKKREEPISDIVRERSYSI